MKELPTFVLGMAANMVMLALIILLGPGVIPAQLDQCWVELRKNVPNCSTKQVDGVTFMKDLRCIRAAKGIQLTAADESGWYRVVKIQEPTVTGKSRTRPGTPAQEPTPEK